MGNPIVHLENLHDASGCAIGETNWTKSTRHHALPVRRGIRVSAHRRCFLQWSREEAWLFPSCLTPIVSSYRSLSAGGTLLRSERMTPGSVIGCVVANARSLRAAFAVISKPSGTARSTQRTKEVQTRIEENRRFRHRTVPPNLDCRRQPPQTASFSTPKQAYASSTLGL